MAWSPGYEKGEAVMVLKRVLLGALSVVILPCGAFGQDLEPDLMRFSGTVGGGETFYDAPNNHIGDWNANGSVLFTLDNPGFNFQGNFSNDSLSASVNGGDYWTYGGDVYWRDFAGAIGLNIDTHSLSNVSVSGKGADFNNFGGFGQWYLTPEVTLEAKGGWLTQHYQGPYGSVGAVGYPLDAVAVSLTADYAKDNHLQPELKDIGIDAEWLPLPEFPVSIAFSYTRAQLTRLPVPQDPESTRSLDVYGVALKVYFGGGGGGDSLRDYQRNGAVTYDGAPPGILEFGY
jgi:hypothetical protein